MTSIFLKLEIRDGKKVMEATFAFDSEIIRFLKGEGWRWEPSKKVWWIPYQTEKQKALEHSFAERTQLSLELTIVDLKRDLILRNYSRKTIKTYLGQIKLFFAWVSTNRNSNDPFLYRTVSDPDVIQYLDYSLTIKKLSFASIRSILQALRFFWREVLKRPFPKKVKYPRKEEHLPDILSKGEIMRLVAVLPNPKHKLILLLAYSTGMRLSEIVSLKMKDIDPEREVIHVKMGKGKKDRIVPLSKTFLKIWKEHSDFILRANNPYIFPGQYPNTHLSSRTAQKIFENAKKSSQLQKEVSFHSLRHAFATHLLEAGTGIRHIQMLLGHANLRTTERYARLSRIEILKVPSPLDLD